MVPNINENGRLKNLVLNHLVKNCPKFPIWEPAARGGLSTYCRYDNLVETINY